MAKRGKNKTTLPKASVSKEKRGSRGRGLKRGSNEDGACVMACRRGKEKKRELTVGFVRAGLVLRFEFDLKRGKDERKTGERANEGLSARIGNQSRKVSGNGYLGERICQARHLTGIKEGTFKEKSQEGLRQSGGMRAARARNNVK